MRDAIASMLRADDMSLDRLRSIVIACGQWEQAAFDADSTDADDTLPHLCDLTDCAADAFCVAWRASQARGGQFSTDQFDLGPWVDAIDAQLRALSSDNSSISSRDLSIKVPEGFAFYSLLPDQYAAAAQRWSRDYAGMAAAARASVVGLRSIGTTLSAVVASMLRFDGWRVSRFTVRPSGDPFDRRVTLPEREASTLGPTTLALIVDEGPGLSGSSTYGTARALVEAGVQPRYLSILPGHGNGPGSAASDEIRAWWESTPKYVVSLTDLRWGGQSITERLAERTVDLLDPDCRLRDVRIEDLGAGAWRCAAYDDTSVWPLSRAPFETAMYRVTLPDSRSVLWRFSGLSMNVDGRAQAQVVFDELSKRAGEGWTLAPGAIESGFIAMPWIDGTRFVNPWVGDSVTESGVLAMLAKYIAQSAGESLPVDERNPAFERMAEMTAANIGEALGVEYAFEARRRADSVRDRCLASHARSYGDGRLAPHEWIRTGTASVLKANAFRHVVDHTMVGQQTVEWDLAGAIVEWDLDANSAQSLLDSYTEAGGVAPSTDVLEFYCLAYAAYRLGIIDIGRQMNAGNTVEIGRLDAAAAYYRGRVDARLRDMLSKAA